MPQQQHEFMNWLAWQNTSDNVMEFYRKAKKSVVMERDILFKMYAMKKKSVISCSCLGM